MSKVYTGRDGRLVIDGTTQIKVTNWSMTGALEVLETTTLGDDQRSYAPGVQEFSGSASLLYYNDSGRNDAASALKKIIKTSGVSSNETVSLTFRLVEGNTNHDVTFNAYITSATFSASVGEVSAAQISFPATGALTSVTL